MVEGVFPQVARRLVQEFTFDEVARQYEWHQSRRVTKEDNPAGMLVAAIQYNWKPPKGHPDEPWYKENFPGSYWGEDFKPPPGYVAPKVRGGGRKARRTANKGSVAGAAIFAGGLHFGAKHGALGKEKRQHQDKFGLKITKDSDGNTKT